MEKTINDQTHATLAELIEASDAGDLWNGIEYVDWSTADESERMTNMEIVNPENDQHIMTAWVPTDMASELALELANARRAGKVHY